MYEPLKAISEIIKIIEEQNKMLDEQMVRMQMGTYAAQLQLVSTRFMKSRRPLDWDTSIGIHKALFLLDLFEP